MCAFMRHNWQTLMAIRSITKIHSFTIYLITSPSAYSSALPIVVLKTRHAQCQAVAPDVLLLPARLGHYLSAFPRHLPGCGRPGGEGRGGAVRYSGGWRSRGTYQPTVPNASPPPGARRRQNGARVTLRSEATRCAVTVFLVTLDRSTSWPVC